MEKSEKVLWDKCFESMSEDEYCSTTLGKLDDIFREYLINKAAAYDRLMSGGKKTPKEVANFLGKPIAMDRVGAWYEHKHKPSIGEGYCEGVWVSGLTGNDYIRSISVQIDFTGDWQDSLTLPDGWEERVNQEETFDYNLEQLGLK